MNKKRRYYSLRSAIKRSMEDVMDTGSPMTIYDTERGIDLAVVTTNRGDIHVNVVSPRLFKREWAHT